VSSLLGNVPLAGFSENMALAVNLLSLSAQVEAVKPLRYTPAGLPALDIELSHESSVSDNGQQRQIKLVVRALATGGLAESLARQSVGSMWQFSGFLAASRSKPVISKTLVFHIQSFQPFLPDINVT
jgi:primosomal replication protein N